MNSQSQLNIWEPTAYLPGECRYWELGPIKFWVLRAYGEWHIAHEYADGDVDRFCIAQPCSPPPHLDWERWAVDDRQSTLQLEPVLPDRPIIVRPENRIHIMPRQTVQFFIGVPYWVRLKSDTRHHLTDLPTRVLSNSWFGDTASGELCYMSVSMARRDISEMPLKRFRAVSIVEIRNDDHKPLPIERICLRAPYLRLYQGTKCLWTNEQRIVYRGPNDLSKLVMTRSAPNIDPDARLVGEPREELKRGLFTRSLGTLTPLEM